MQLFKLKFSVLFLLFIPFSKTFAQKELNAAGGTAKGTAGTTTFTINSTINTKATGSNGYIISGVQQPKEITGILPITLLSFTAKLQDKNKVQLHWSTANEYNNAFFTIEKSNDGKTFETLAIIKSNGNNTNTQNYQALDEKPFAITFYRLKQTDINGKFSYSSIVTIKLSNAKEGITIFPNPTSNVVYLQLTDIANKKLHYTIVDLQGKIVATQTINSNTTTIAVAQLASNTYIINIVDETKTISSFKLIKL